MHQPQSHRQRGQSTVEFALVVPLVAFCAMALVGVVSLCLTLLALNDTARNAARAAATATDPQQAAHTIASASGAQATVQVHPTHGLISVTVHHTARVPMLGTWLPGIRLTAHSSIMQEPPIVLG